MGKTVRIGNGCGFWGDNLDAPVELAAHGGLDYLTLEYLAELTMSILARQRQSSRDPRSGYASDFLDVLERLVPYLREQPPLKIVTNAGGIDPVACAEAARQRLTAASVPERRIGVVTGDDLASRLRELLSAGHPLTNLDTGEPLESVLDRVVSANAYLGAGPIVEALGQGADIVITGRVADASLTVGPAVHEFGWKWDDLDKLAQATVAGHLIECGAQVTGGLWCNWTDTDLSLVGYPVAMMTSRGAFVLSKPPGTGGAVNEETIAEQLLYEVNDPASYLTPDVVADFTSVTLEHAAQDALWVTGARGKPATDSYKVSIAYRDGFTSAGTLTIAGPDAAAKARRCGEILLARLARAGVTPARHRIEALGGGDLLDGVVPAVGDPPEVVMRVAVWDAEKRVVDRFSKEFAPLVTSGPPGVTGYTTGRPPVREVFAYWPSLIDKRAVRPEVHFR
jgi:hypothetical protein